MNHRWKRHLTGVRENGIPSKEIYLSLYWFPSKSKYSIKYQVLTFFWERESKSRHLFSRFLFLDKLCRNHWSSWRSKEIVDPVKYKPSGPFIIQKVSRPLWWVVSLCCILQKSSSPLFNSFISYRQFRWEDTSKFVSRQGQCNSSYCYSSIFFIFKISIVLISVWFYSLLTGLLRPFVKYDCLFLIVMF